MSSILSLLTYTDAQHQAVTARDADIVVTAGAGSGKTRALVGRYVRLLEDGLPARSVVAITFTEKAAREMRSRTRQIIQDWLNKGPESTGRSRWEEIYAELDGAPIGTIHSLCATILRTHPAEAGVDPAFDVLDEGAAAALRSQAVESALAWAANDAGAAGLFGLLDENGLRRSVSTLLEKRLDAGAAFATAGPDPLSRWQAELGRELGAFLDQPDTRAAATELELLRSDGILARLAGDKLAATIENFLDAWEIIASAQAAGDFARLLAALPAARRAMQPSKGQKGNWPDIEIPRRALTLLRDAYDSSLDKLLTGANDWSLDQQVAAALPHLQAAFRRAEMAYIQAKELRQALDFDDLEAGAVRLLDNHADIRAYWQSEVRAVLVDEFQDTNDRQRRIVYAVTGFADRGLPTSEDLVVAASGTTEVVTTSSLRTTEVVTTSSFRTGSNQDEERSPAVAGHTPGRLFVVGDAKQSIYRFRGADVTVYREVQRDIAAAGGVAINLDLTFRAHEPLVQQLNALLAPIMEGEDSHARPYVVPFAPLRAHRESPESRVRAPYIEFCLGVGETTAEGRAAAATALARRLRELRDAAGLDWGDMALLFRASTGFANYEDALERAGIPFVTVAGRGFYDRPEIRDLLCALRAIADPTDDGAMAGLLRSPAFALTDKALFLLRRDPDGTPRALWAALHGDLSRLDGQDSARAQRARHVVTELSALAGRTTVAWILKQLLDRTHYEAILRSSSPGGTSGGAGERARRNVDKLLADAHASRLVSVGEFLEYLQTLRDVGVREGEAPVEAGDAVQLMTVHKAKGLEFALVVTADAGHQRRGGSPQVLLDPALGPVVRLKGDDDSRSVIHRLAAQRDKDKDDAEERRLLYVAATRAEEMLLISGHVKVSAAQKNPGRLLLTGWLKQLGKVVGLDQVCLDEAPGDPLAVELPDVGGSPLRCCISPKATADSSTTLTAGRPAPTDARREMADISAPAGVQGMADEQEPGFPPPLLKPVAERPAEETDEDLRAREADPPPRVWRVVPTAQRPQGPAWVVGTLVHEALRRWRFPEHDGFDAFLRLHALAAGLTDEAELRATLAEASRLLARFQTHPLYAEMDRAQRHHEVPFAIERDGRVEAGQIDVLYQHAGHWRIVDFKTDRLRNDDELREKATLHAGQVRTYLRSAGQLLSSEPDGFLCYLNVAGAVRQVKVE